MEGKISGRWRAWESVVVRRSRENMAAVDPRPWRKITVWVWVVDGGGLIVLRVGEWAILVLFVAVLVGFVVGCGV
jgi:hypothetical protein